MRINRYNMDNLVNLVWDNCSPEGEELVNRTNIVLLHDIDEASLSYEMGLAQDAYHRILVSKGFAQNDIYEAFRTRYEMSIKKLEEQREVIISILDNLSNECFEKQLAHNFMFDKQGEQWTYSYDTVYRLLAMGIALKRINWYSEQPEILQKSSYHSYYTIPPQLPKYTKIYFKLENEDDIEVNLINKSKLVDMIYYNCSFQFWDIPEDIVPIYAKSQIEYFEYFRLQLKRNLIEKILAFNKKLKLEQDIQEFISKGNSNAKSVKGLDNKDELFKLKLLTDALNSKRH